ncbi:MAG: hypothetical protein J3K34DRAFT_409818 [Monoraphidium minutum]|nr:MAG: hypothetical protein J3K34DRAFT_409818 [Monoraphidium minutum]
MSKSKSHLRVTTEAEAAEQRVQKATWLAKLFEHPSSLAAQTAAAYSELLDEALLDVAVEAHREAKLGLAPDPAPQPQPPPRPLDPQPGARGPTDVFGQTHPPSALDQITCMKCGRKVAAGRFAPHLEKCLGGGRQSSRHATRRGAG